MGRGSAARPIVVLESFRAPRPTTNPYVVQLAQSLAARGDVEVLTFDWRLALLGRYDVVHLHWPEILVAGRTPARAAAGQLRFALLLLRWWAAGTPVVRTVHNLRPHEDVGRIARFLLTRLDALTTVRIHLNPETPEGRTAAGEAVPHRVVLHGDYRDWYAPHPHPEAVPGRVVSAGIVRPYKQVDRLVEVFRAADVPGSSLHVVGAVPDPGVARRVVAAADADPRITLRLEHVDDDTFVREVGEAELVALTYQELHNSGGALAALSLDRPVLVPDTPTTRALATEVGEAWVRRYTAPLEAEDLAAALAVGTPDGSPDLSARRWPDAAVAHRDAFLLARRLRRRALRRAPVGPRP
ncbi:hypothetical protein ACXR2U_17155 [Jatrophihabitans sp. YIM 134969]